MNRRPVTPVNFAMVCKREVQRMSTKCLRFCRAMKKAVPILFCSSILLSRSSAAETLKARDIYVVTVQEEVPIDKVEIFYYLDGPFGGFQTELRHSAIKDGFIVPAKGAALLPVKFAVARDTSHSLLIPIKGAKEMGAAVYCPGYQFARIDVPSLASAKHETSLVLKRLKMIKLSGRIKSYKAVPHSDPVVDIKLLSMSAASVSPAIDVMMPQFDVANRSTLTRWNVLSKGPRFCK